MILFTEIPLNWKEYHLSKTIVKKIESLVNQRDLSNELTSDKY